MDSLIGGMGMSEPGAGTDVIGMGTTATPNADGTKYTLNGAKMWITNGTIDGTDTGDVFLVYAKTGKGRGKDDLTSFLVRKVCPGSVWGKKLRINVVCAPHTRLNWFLIMLRYLLKMSWGSWWSYVMYASQFGD